MSLTLAADADVIAEPADQLVAALAAEDGVVAGVAVDGIAAAPAVDDIVELRSGHPRRMASIRSALRALPRMKLPS